MATSILKLSRLRKMPLRSIRHGIFVVPFTRHKSGIPSGLSKEPLDIRELLVDMMGNFGKTKTGSPKIIRPDEPDQLPSRTMADSYTEALLPIGRDKELKAYLSNLHNAVRIGRILEAFDFLSAWISAKHCQDGVTWKHGSKIPLLFATILVDRIEVRDHNFRTDADMKLRGNVSWVGHSSLEVSMDLTQRDGEDWKHIFDAKFLYVVRNVTTGRKAAVNPLQATNDEERQIIQEGEISRMRRQEARGRSLAKTAPSAGEMAYLHNLFQRHWDSSETHIQSHHLSENATWMEDNEVKTLLLCNPQNVNSYKAIFGGFLMRIAYELAWGNACLFCKARPVFIAMDDVIFRRPVRIGDMLEFTSRIVYTPPKPDNCFLVMTVAEVIDPVTNTRDTSNVFYFTFQGGSPVKRIMPKTYAEMMLFLTGMRIYSKRDEAQGSPLG